MNSRRSPRATAGAWWRFSRTPGSPAPRGETSDRASIDCSRPLARRDVDMVAAWSVDRLGRSLVDLLDFLRELHAKGVDLFLHQQGLDTSTPAGKAMFQMLGVFAEFERAMIVERVRSGLARARERGTKSGKAIGRPKVAAAKEAAVRAALAAGDRGIGKIARDLRVGAGFVHRIATGMRR